ncbi:hypothetical protein ABMA28_000800 [Loxostege sticticalis]|uniref:PH and SEC7 domain-containing protein 2 n=1 Tax=Loxostege sticticalis TaxID=481309 RepID=A0ABD0T3K5_LOXSC
MADERLVVLNRSDNLGFGFSLLGEAGLPHIIYAIEENSPAARSGELEAGDVLLKVNGTDVNRFTTREVLKCLRLSSDPVTLRLKKDPQIKASVRRYLSAAAERRSSGPRTNHDKPNSPPSSNSNSNSSSNSSSNGSGPQSGDSCEALITDERAGRRARGSQPKFEAYMMTGDLMLNLSRVEHPHHNHHAPTHRTHYHRYNSTPASPSESRLCGRADLTQRHNSSPDTGLVSDRANNMFISQPASPAGGGAGAAGELSSRPPHTVRTSRSEDHLQKESSLSAVGVDMEEDVTSSLNTLLDARPDSATPAPKAETDSERDRIVWTYNAPVSCASERTHCNGSGATSNSTSISDGMSQRSSSPASPTSVSSGVMSSRATPPHRAPHPHMHHHHRPLNGDMSLSEAVSNISSPDYQDQDDMFETGRECPRMELSDPSDSDSTILVSEPCHKRAKSNSGYSEHGSDLTLNGEHNDYRIVIQVKGPDKQNANVNENVNNNNNNTNYAQNGKENGHNSPENQGYQELGSGSDGGSDEGSDGDSLHSFHYSPKAVDIPSAERLAKRLYHLDGFKKSDVSRHLSKNNEFSRAVAEEYVKHFEFSGATLDAALRTFLARFALSGETQERERVLVHFSRRYLECNPGSFNSQDAVHTLTCAIMLLNTDLHGGGAGAFRRMSCAEFVENLAELNDGENFPRDTLKQLYHAIRAQPLQWALDTEAAPATGGETRASAPVGSNPFLDVPDQSRAVEYKKGYVMRKCCVDANGKKTPFGRRGWKMFYCTLRDLVLYLHKDEHGFRRSQMSDNLHNAIRIHHALATKATDYTKKQHVFRLQTADQAEYLFQTSDSKELCSWVETINFVCAAYSAPPLAGAVGSQRKFQRPLLPCTHTKLTMREQVASHEERAARLEEELAALRHARDNTPHARDKDHYLVYEIKRYRTYAYVMRARAAGAGADDAAPALPERAPHAPPAPAAPHAPPP